jgi:hypothetical protein
MTAHDISIRNKLITSIKQRNESRFRVFDNTGEDKEVIAGQFPDVIFKQKEPPPNNNILFVMKIETSGDLVNSVPLWQALGSVSSVFYIVVPKDKIDEAKKLASIAGVRTRFAWYELEGGEVKQVHYE